MDALGNDGPLIIALLDAAALRHRTIARNLANAETPGYRAEGVRFSKELEEALKSGDPDRLRGAKPETFERDTRVKLDGSSVDMEVEQGEMSRNALAYQTLLAVATMKQSEMRLAIAGRTG